MIQRVSPQRRPREVKCIKPVILDVTDRKPVVGVDVEAQRHLFRADAQRLAQEADEESEHGDVRIDESDRVSVLCTFGPIQEAARHVKRVALPRLCSALLLVSEPSCLISPPPLLRPALDDLRIL
jgi:hypothetical protein